MAMELTTAPTAVSGHHSDADTPPASTPTNSKPAAGFLAYANGSLKRHYPRDPATKELPEVEVIIYRECLRNHAASIGGHALDGCCEFMPPAPANFNPSDPTSLRCAACGCHRNFHRRDPDDPTPLHRHRPLPPPFLSPVPTQVTMPAFQRPTTPAAAPAMNGGGRKRFRTKFSEDQKQRLRDFSDKFGWKIQKIDKGVVAEFCNEVGVGREVLKVWMHNHKNSNNIGIGSSVNGGNGGGVHIESVHHHDPNSSGDGSSSSSGSQ